MLELDIIIVGAGIAGLASAITLSRAGHNVQVLEKSSFKREAGFMITLTAPATRVLESFGFDFRRARSTDCDFIKIYDGLTLNQMESWSTRGYTESPNDQMRSYYRPDLLNELKRIVLLESKDWKTPSLKLDAEVESVDIYTASVHLKDGSSISGDIIIGADGERSLVRSAFTSADPITQVPVRTYRAIIPTEVLLEDSEAHDVYASTKKTLSIFVTPDHRGVVWFEGRDGLLQDLECNYPLAEGDDRRAEQDSTQAKEKMLQKFGDLHPGIVKALRLAERVSDWELWQGTGVWHMHEGRALIIGDAAHSMLPFDGQGGCQGIDDAGALGVLLRHMENTEEVVERLKLMEELRRERAAIFQSIAGVNFGTEAQIAKDNPSHLINKTNIRSPEGHIEYMSNYNVMVESEKILTKSRKLKVDS